MQNKQTRVITAVDHKSDSSNLKDMTTSQVLARLPEKDARYQQGRE